MSDIGQAVVELLPRLRRYAQQLTRDPERADDLVQTCLVKALSKQHLWAENTDLRAWLFTILHNQFINEVRSLTKEKGMLRTAAITNTTFVPNSDPELCVMVSSVRDAVRSLSKEHQEVLLQVTVECLAYDEIASKLGLRVGTVRSRLARARENLRNMMEYPAKPERRRRYCQPDRQPI
jgi:RNA polymerase sigma-70 factor (ECF subfamily)